MEAWAASSCCCSCWPLSFSTRVAAAALAASEPRARRVWASASRASSADTFSFSWFVSSVTLAFWLLISASFFLRDSWNCLLRLLNLPSCVSRSLVLPSRAFCVPSAPCRTACSSPSSRARRVSKSPSILVRWDCILPSSSVRWASMSPSSLCLVVWAAWLALAISVRALCSWSSNSLMRGVTSANCCFVVLSSCCTAWCSSKVTRPYFSSRATYLEFHISSPLRAALRAICWPSKSARSAAWSACS
mmetsp:Transcript_7870/g.20996  ORF Transcript_7870/g.20996 Transcript_7870/m.20996 type:complete len:247 (-) Transcript_7870:1998-2738(-)